MLFVFIVRRGIPCDRCRKYHRQWHLINVYQTDEHLVDYEEFCYDSMAKDWLNYDTGELLTKFIPNGRLEYLLRNRIDKEMQ